MTISQITKPPQGRLFHVWLRSRDYLGRRALAASQCLRQFKFVPDEFVEPRFSSSLSIPLHIKKPPQGRLFHVWRRERDSNPRYAINVYTLSRRAPSATQPSLQNWLQPIRLRARILAKISISARILCFCQKHLGSKGRWTRYVA